MHIGSLLPWLALIAALVPAAVSAQAQDPAEVQRTAEAFVRAQTANLPGRVEVVLAPLEPNLNLSRCENVEPYVPAGTRLWGNSTVGVRCTKPKKWTLFIPAQVQVWADVAVSARTLTRGQILSAADLATQNLDLAQLPQGVFTDPNALIGKMVSTQVAGGTPLRPDMLRAAAVILQGQTVRVVFTGEGVSVSSEGRALGNAGVGEALQVRMASGKVIKGIVKAPGTVEVH
jgi:flagella basal body P-ring formation protein FlgA